MSSFLLYGILTKNISKNNISTQKCLYNISKYHSFAVISSNRSIRSQYISKSIINVKERTLLIGNQFNNSNIWLVRGLSDDKSKIHEQLEFLKDKTRSDEVKQSTQPLVSPPKKSLYVRFKDEMIHYYHGFKLLWMNIKITTNYIKRVLKGETLSRRERKLLLKTVADLFRLVPFLAIIAIPFAEFALPFLIKFFPNMLPSTFDEKNKNEVILKKTFRAKLKMAQFFQDTLEEMVVNLPTAGKHSEEFKEFIKKIKLSGEMPNPAEFRKHSQLFDDDLLLNSLTKSQLKALCSLLSISTVGPSNFLRLRIYIKISELLNDDKIIAKEGVKSLNVTELQEACKMRGMSAYGLSEDRLRLQMENWLMMSLDHKFPISLLLLTELLSYDTGSSNLTDHDIVNTVKQLPDFVIGEAEIKAADLEGVDADRAKKIASLLHEEQAISQEERENKSSFIDDNTISVGLKKIEDNLPTDNDTIKQLKNEKEAFKQDLEELQKKIPSKKHLEKSKISTRMSKKLDELIVDIDHLAKNIDQTHSKLDADGDGVISKYEIIKLLLEDSTNSSQESKNNSEEKIKKIMQVFDAIDEDKDGKINTELVKKLLYIVNETEESYTEQELLDVLDAFKKLKTVTQDSTFEKYNK